MSEKSFKKGGADDTSIAHFISLFSNVVRNVLLSGTLFAEVLFKRKTWCKYVKFHTVYSHGAMRSQVTLIPESGSGFSAADFNCSKNGLPGKQFLTDFIKYNRYYAVWWA